ncbi:MAG: hypothetical protein PHX21_13590 [bacterium]|nr:hypothetical protein [bacterium]
MPIWIKVVALSGVIFEIAMLVAVTTIFILMGEPEKVERWKKGEK